MTPEELREIKNHTKPDCVFQYADAFGRISENTDLITRVEAEQLWEKYIPQFTQDVEKERNPEMCIWIDMDDVYSFGKTAENRHWCGDDFRAKDGRLIKRRKKH